MKNFLLMPNYRRAHDPGGTFFFTVKTEKNSELFSNRSAVDLLRTVFKQTKQKWPFEIIATVVLPDHLHCIWSLP